jgi:hypothetical protein
MSPMTPMAQASRPWLWPMSETGFTPDETRFTSTPRVKAFRQRARRGVRRMAVFMSREQLDALEEKG